MSNTWAAPSEDRKVDAGCNSTAGNPMAARAGTFHRERRGVPLIVPRGTPPPPLQTPLYTIQRLKVPTRKIEQALRPVSTPSALEIRLVALRAELVSVMDRRRRLELARDDDWALFTRDRSSLPYNPKTIAAWRNANVRAAKLEFVEIPTIERCIANPSWRPPNDFPRPRDVWRMDTLADLEAD